MSSFYLRPIINYNLIYVLSVIFALHNSLVLFINSSYIEKFVPSELVGTLFMVGSSLAIFGFLFISRILKKVGNVALTIGLATAEIIVLLTLALSSTPALVIVAFVLFLVINPLIFLNLDIFSESIIGDDEESTGFKRGLVLTLISAAAMIGPLSIGFIAGPDDANLQNVYLVSAVIFSLFVLVVLFKFSSFEDPDYREIKVLDAIAAFWSDINIRFALLSQFLLQLCFSWLVIYVPLYLSTVIGLSWSEIGLAIAVGTLAYVLLEFPVGYIADKYIGEKEMMMLGFLILTLSFGALSFTTDNILITWMALMFIIRVGASLVETTTESYFFKHTKGTDTNFLTFFRISRPLGIISGGLLGSLSLLFLSFQYIFIIMAVVLLFGIYCALKIEDTK